jgi:hypothetical protein
MEPVVQAAVISGTAVMIAAGIQATGNVVAARKRAAEKPETKEITQDVTTAQRTKRDRSFWITLVFIGVWWVSGFFINDLSKDRYALAVLILMPSMTLYMVMMKVIVELMDLRK